MNKQAQKQKAAEKGNESDDIGQMQDEDSSYEKSNQIFQLNSKINQLLKTNQQISLKYQGRIKSLESKYEKINTQNNQKKIENTNLTLKINKLQQQNQQLKNKIEMHRHQIEGSNRRTADFHRSIQDNNGGLGDPTDLIKQLLQKDKQIQRLKSQIGQPEVQQNLTNQGVTLQQTKNLQNTIDELRKKQIAYKRQYESMLQSKEEIIKKMSVHYEENLKRNFESKDKIILDLKRQIEEMINAKDQLWREIKIMSDRVLQSERMLSKKNNEHLKKEQQLRSAFENQKQNITKSLLQKSKKQLKSLQQQCKHHQEMNKQLQTNFQILKQENAKLKTQINSISQYNSYLQATNRQNQEIKREVQSTLYKKQEEILEMQEKYFMEISEIKRKNSDERKELQNKIYQLQQELIAKKNTIQRVQKLLKQQQQSKQSSNIKQEYALITEVQSLKEQNKGLQKSIQKLQKALALQTTSQNELQDHINKLNEDMIKNAYEESSKAVKEFIKEKEQIVIQKIEEKQEFQEKIKKLQMVCELLQIQKEEKMGELKESKLKIVKFSENELQIKNQLEKSQRKVKQIQEDYRTLQLLYEQLNDKYKLGVQEMQQKIKQTSQKIDQQRKKAQHRKSISNNQSANLREQLNESQQKIKLLQSQIKSQHQKNELSKQQLNSKLQKVTLQYTQSQKTVFEAQRRYNTNIEKMEQQLQKERYNLQDYIKELEENGEMLTKKINIIKQKENKLKEDKKKIEGELKLARVQLGASQKEVKHLLAKCRQFEDVSRELISDMEIFRQKHQIQNQKISSLERNRKLLQSQLESSHDQIKKLNFILMTKQQQLKKLKASSQLNSAKKGQIYINPQPLYQKKSPIYKLSPFETHQIQYSVGIQKLEDNFRMEPHFTSQVSMKVPNFQHPARAPVKYFHLN